jgi:hypothetical protein
MTERDQIYIKILKYGLQRIRDCSELGLIAYCAVESEHLHNLPSLVGEKNEHRHTYYFQKERTLYLERVDRTTPGIDFTLNRYSELWDKLNTK